MSDLFKIAAQMQFPGATIAGSGAFAIVRSMYGKPTNVALFTTATEAIQEQANNGGQRVRIEAAPAHYRPPMRVGYGRDDD